MGHARALINVKNKEKQLNIFHDAIANGFSVREVEQIVKEFAESTYNRTSKKKTMKLTKSLKNKTQWNVELKNNRKQKQWQRKNNEQGKNNNTKIHWRIASNGK